MEKRIPGSMRTREALSELIEGHLSTPDARSQLVLLATRLIVEEALEAESRDALGRGYYEHGGDPGRGYRNGNRTGRLKTAEGMVNTTAPQIAGREEASRSEIRTHLKGRSEALEDLAVEMLVRGLSVRDIEDTFRNDDGSLLLSRTAVSEIGERLWQDYQAFANRDLGGYDIAYLFVDGIAERIRPGQRREPVLAAWGMTHDGKKVLLHMMSGSKEDPCPPSSGHAGPRPWRSAAGGLGWRSGDHQGDRDLLSTLRTPLFHRILQPRSPGRTPGPSSGSRPVPPTRRRHGQLPATWRPTWSGHGRANSRPR